MNKREKLRSCWYQVKSLSNWLWVFLVVLFIFAIVSGFFMIKNPKHWLSLFSSLIAIIIAILAITISLKQQSLTYLHALFSEYAEPSVGKYIKAVYDIKKHLSECPEQKQSVGTYYIIHKYLPKDAIDDCRRKTSLLFERVADLIYSGQLSMNRTLKLFHTFLKNGRTVCAIEEFIALTISLRNSIDKMTDPDKIPDSFVSAWNKGSSTRYEIEPGSENLKKIVGLSLKIDSGTGLNFKKTDIIISKEELLTIVKKIKGLPDPENIFNIRLL